MLAFVIAGIISAIILSGFFSGLETAAYAANRLRLDLLASKNDKRALAVLDSLKNMPLLITTMLVGTNTFVALGSYFLTTYLENNSELNAELWTTIILTPSYFVFAETLPKRFGYVMANNTLITSIKAIQAFNIFFYPLNKILGLFSNLMRYILRKLGFTDIVSTGRDLLTQSLEARAAEGALSNEQYKMASKVMQLEGLTVEDILIPASNVFAIEESVSCEVAGSSILRSGYARALVTNKHGQLTGKVITLNAIMKTTGSLKHPVSSLAIETLVIDARTPVLKALAKMRETGTRVAVTTKAGGGIIGAVPVSRLLSCVVSGIKL